MELSNACVDAWVTFLNSQDASTASTFLHEDIQIEAYQEGADGPSTHHSGLQAVIAWVQYPPSGSFVFHVTSLKQSPESETLASGSTSLSATYQVSHTASDFKNQGRWTFHIADGRIHRILHIPDTLQES